MIVEGYGARHEAARTDSTPLPDRSVVANQRAITYDDITVDHGASAHDAAFTNLCLVGLQRDRARGGARSRGLATEVGAWTDLTARPNMHALFEGNVWMNDKSLANHAARPHDNERRYVDAARDVL